MVLPVWEGPANIQALELLRVSLGKARGDADLLARLSGIVETLPKALAAEAAALEATATRCRAAFSYLRRRPEEGPRHARRLLELLADALCAALLL